MQIGIDASRAFKEKRTGTEEYSFQFIKNLRSLNMNGHQIFLYVKNREEIKLKLPQNFFVVEIKRGKFWTQVGLANKMKKNPVDILFIPAHCIPFVHPKLTVVTIHGLEFKYHPESYSFKERLILEFNTLLNVKWSRKIIVPSENTKKDLVKFYKVNVNKIKVIHHGTKNIHLPVLNDKQRDNLNYYILFIGRLEKRKNIVNLVKAFELFKKKYKSQITNYQLVLVGKEGFGFEEIRLIIKQSEYKNDIIIKGYVSEEEKEKLYQNANVFVFIPLYEGFGLPILEAMSHGIPVICSKVSSIPEIAGEAGILVNPVDTEEIAQVIERVICKEDMKNDMIKKGLKNVQKFSWEKCVQETIVELLNC